MRVVKVNRLRGISCILCFPFLIKVKAESEKGGLKLNIQKTKIMASGPITSWQIDGERAPKSLQMVIAAMKLKDAYSLKGNL